MKRKQIYIEEQQDQRLKRLAANRGVPEAFVIREAVEKYLATEEGPFGFDRMEDSPLWQMVGLVDDPDIPVDSSINLDHYLYGAPRKYRLTKDGRVVRNPLRRDRVR